jgi:cytoskeleton protein RodZ
VSWVAVVDAKGSVQLRKTLVAGELVGVSGALPLIVVVGKADTMDVSVAGQPFNLMGIAKDNVARFEVK